MGMDVDAPHGLHARAPCIPMNSHHAALHAHMAGNMPARVDGGVPGGPCTCAVHLDALASGGPA